MHTGMLVLLVHPSGVWKPAVVWRMARRASGVLCGFESRLHTGSRGGVRSARTPPGFQQGRTGAVVSPPVRHRGIAQLGGASALGAEGRRFKSCYPDVQVQQRVETRGQCLTALCPNTAQYEVLSSDQVWWWPKCAGCVEQTRLVIDGIAVRDYGPEFRPMLTIVS